MSAALIAALFFTVILLVVTGYFFIGALPLLVLKHDTPLDARFVRGFFDTYYLGVLLTASPAALGYAVAGRFLFAAGMAALALLAVVLRRTLLPKMDALRAPMQDGGAQAIRAFRRLHLAAIACTLAQLVSLVWSLIAVSMQMR